VLGLAVLALSLAATVACTQPAEAHRQLYRRPATGTPGGSPAGPAGIALAPSADVGGVGVTDPVTATAISAVLDTVTLTDAQGNQIAGDFDATRRRWQATAPLAYNRRYTLTAVATASDGKRLTQASPFTTVKPANLTLPYLRANNGLLLADRSTYGVGQPVVVGFDEKIPDRVAAERALEVVTEPHVDGVWHWFSDTEVHWRPREYWQPGTKVTVNANVFGKNLGNGLYGQRNVATSFTIGPSRIAIADDNTHHIQAFIDGQLVRDIPTAMGLHQTVAGTNGAAIDLRTHSGVHVVLGNEHVTHMTSASFGLTGPAGYDEQVYWTTHISYSGEYVHAAPWSVAQQGHSDASHGCLNVNTDNAIWFHNTFGPGDIVDIRNTGLTLDATDGLGDWGMSWNDWIKGSAVPAAPLVNHDVDMN
jgi:lipoprotein-anchoring transpeptidase ErfK/SrfK